MTLFKLPKCFCSFLFWRKVKKNKPTNRNGVDDWNIIMILIGRAKGLFPLAGKSGECAGDYLWGLWRKTHPTWVTGFGWRKFNFLRCKGYRYLLATWTLNQRRLPSTHGIHSQQTWLRLRFQGTRRIFDWLKSWTGHFVHTGSFNIFVLFTWNFQRLGV